MLDKISYEKHLNPNKGGRIEFWINNFDYMNGIDYLAKLFCEKYQMQANEKIEGIFFDLIKLYSNGAEYVLMWHEDIGTLIYSANQDSYNTAQLETQLNSIVREINSHL